MEKLPDGLSKTEEEKYISLLNDEKKRAQAREVLIQHNLRLVAFVIKTYFPTSWVEYDELFSIGTVGLINGIDKFNPELGFTLSTYLSASIINEIKDKLMDLNKRKKNEQNMISLEAKVYENIKEGTLTFEEVVPDGIDYEGIVCDKAEREYQLNIVKEYLSKVKERDRRIFEMSWGVNGTEIVRAEDIAKNEKISRQRVSKIRKEIEEEVREFYKRKTDKFENREK